MLGLYWSVVLGFSAGVFAGSSSTIGSFFVSTAGSTGTSGVTGVTSGAASGGVTSFPGVLGAGVAGGVIRSMICWSKVGGIDTGSVDGTGTGSGMGLGSITG